MFFAETADRVINLHSEIRAYDDEYEQKFNPEGLGLRLSEMLWPRPPQWTELRTFLQAQSPETLWMLLAVIELGQDDFAGEHMLGARDYMKRTRDHMKRAFSEHVGAVSRIIGTGPLADWLQAGLAKLSKAGIDVNSLDRMQRLPSRIKARG
jgi:hypothetical protein